VISRTSLYDLPLETLVIITEQFLDQALPNKQAAYNGLKGITGLLLSAGEDLKKTEGETRNLLSGIFYNASSYFSRVMTPLKLKIYPSTIESSIKILHLEPRILITIDSRLFSFSKESEALLSAFYAQAIRCKVLTLKDSDLVEPDDLVDLIKKIPSLTSLSLDCQKIKAIDLNIPELQEVLTRVSIHPEERDNSMNELITASERLKKLQSISFGLFNVIKDEHLKSLINIESMSEIEILKGNELTLTEMTLPSRFQVFKVSRATKISSLDFFAEVSLEAFAFTDNSLLTHDWFNKIKPDKLKFLNLTGCSQLDSLKHFENSPLESLIIGFTKISWENLRQLNSTKTLHTLSFSRCPEITDTAIEILKRFRIQKLFLNYSEISNDSYKKLFTLPYLNHLIIQGNSSINTFDIPLEAKVSILDHQNCSGINDSTMSNISKISSLTKLNISCTTITDEGLLQIKNSNSIKKLIARNCPEITTEAVLDIWNNKSMEKIDTESSEYVEEDQRLLISN